MTNDFIKYASLLFGVLTVGVWCVLSWAFTKNDNKEMEHAYFRGVLLTLMMLVFSIVYDAILTYIVELQS